LHHAVWALNNCPGWGPSCTAADQLIEWLTSNMLTLENNTQVPTRIGRTNQQDSILDLTFWNHAATTNNTFTDWECCPDLALHSNHNAITWSIHADRENNSNVVREPDTKYHVNTSRQLEWRQAYLDAIRDSVLMSLNSQIGVITATETIIKACDHATAITVPARTTHLPDKAKWWNDNCAIALCHLQSAHNQERPRA
jgi:hypothetical protein